MTDAVVDQLKLRDGKIDHEWRNADVSGFRVRLRATGSKMAMNLPVGFDSII